MDFIVEALEPARGQTLLRKELRPPSMGTPRVPLECTFVSYSFLHLCLGSRTHQQCAIRDLCKMLIPAGFFDKLIYEVMHFLMTYHILEMLW